MKIIPILLSIILFSSIISVSDSFGETRTCRTGFELIFKATTDSPACVKPSTAEKLVARGWGIMPINSMTPIEISSTNVVEANNLFAIDFYSKVAKDNDGNIFFSPWSISTAFAIIYEGARENTANEVRQVFEFPADDKQRRSEFASVIDNLNEKDAKYKLQVANALWLAERFVPLPDYVDTAKTYYDSEISSVNFITDEGVNTINEWVAEKTEDKIKKIFELGSTDKTTRLAITNAIYFKGMWVNQFNKDSTSDRNFRVDSDKTVMTPMMHLPSTTLNYTRNEQLAILEMPYEGDNLSMLILLPNDVDGINSLEDLLTTENLSQWKNDLSEIRISVLMPKFTLETAYDLKNKLPDLGLKLAFDPNMADFSGITESEPLFIQQAVHKAFVDVNEEGTEAAAVTGIGIGATSAPPMFNADHPFVFIIQEKETGNILFMGRIVNPIA